MTIEQYIEIINSNYKLGNATEHIFRDSLEQLIQSLVPGILANNEPNKQSSGASDYILTKNDIPISFIEVKVIGDKNLYCFKKPINKEQLESYKKSLNNLIFTDYIDFHLYRDGQFVTKISIAENTSKGIEPLSENFENFEKFIEDFFLYSEIPNPQLLISSANKILGRGVTSLSTKEIECKLKEKLEQSFISKGFWYDYFRYDNRDGADSFNTPLKDVKGGLEQKIGFILQKIFGINILSFGLIGSFLLSKIAEIKTPPILGMAISMVAVIVIGLLRGLIKFTRERYEI
jgi:hypothetical protein